MKYIMLIVVLIVGGTVAYQLFLAKPPAGTPNATAKDFVDAALKNDLDAARALSVSAAAGQAERVAAQIHAAQPDPMSVRFRPMRAESPRKGLTAMFSGQILAIELIKEGEEWKIVMVGLSGS